MVRTCDEKDVLLKTFAEITSLMSSGKDNRIILQKIIESALSILPSRKVYLIFLDSHRIVKYTGTIRDKGTRIAVEDMPASAGIVNWLQREYESAKSSERVLSLDLSMLATEFLQHRRLGAPHREEFAVRSNHRDQRPGASAIHR